MKKFSIDEIEFGLLQPYDDLTKLDCTEDDKSDPLGVNKFIHEYARTAHDSKLTVAYTVKHDKKLIACFTVSVFVIKAKKLSDEEQVKESPIKSYPAVLLGQMCVWTRYIVAETLVYTYAHLHWELQATSVNESAACVWFYIQTRTS